MFFLATNLMDYTPTGVSIKFGQGFDQHLSGHQRQEEGGPWLNQWPLKRAIRIGILQLIYNFFETFEPVLAS